ncbi:UDP-2,3-diacetamido-2,3-dideoxy-D-glucuronate 2-epimerase [uncultured spirochete]|jgi:UDP-GlcNAc3NAcA epimerase|uniref:UDP-2,3-diacetamido-2,3-dideoxy-D-glucuronate 2-epimerase n=1 Tax=uncultured spirochete TaxID=156406 RepID=A0A3P3XHW3_9SPIR|nr:UDP-2,3-diacetamido-2,3-dideoxy-D-glucuronate 2-epimerase [uncultured spirochete]
MLEIMTIVGARPQFVKAAVFSRQVRARPYADKIRETIVHTGQHYDENMSDIFFREMEIPEPDVNLGIGSGTHGAVTGAMLAGIERLILERKPDLVLVYGDTNSTLAGALAASKLHVPVAHVEAGLRSYMMIMPEEQNRRLADHLATWLFCPTNTAVENLAKEGIVHHGLAHPSADNKAVLQCGDIMYEASRYYRPKAMEQIEARLRALPDRFALLTLHRAENTDDPTRISAIVRALNRFDSIEFVFPVHPRTRKILAQYGLELKSHIHAIEPVGYFEMLALEDKCSFVVTDSGGVQKEAYFFQKPCITLRDATEWRELVEHGWNTLTGADETAILAALASMPKYGDDVTLYGDGTTAARIADALLSWQKVR